MNHYSKDDIVEVLCNPKGIKSTAKYAGQLAQVVIAVGSDAVLLKFEDGKEFTVENDYIRELS